MIRQEKLKLAILTGAVSIGIAMATSALLFAAPKVIPGAKAKAPVFDASVREIFTEDARKLLEGAPADRNAQSQPAANVVKPAAQTGNSPEGEGWSKLISATTLEDEIKQQLAAVEKAVRSPSDFKGGGYKDARIAFSYLATLFGVIEQYDANVRWKKDAAALTATFARVGKNCKVGTDSAFKEARLRFDDLSDLIRGGNPELLQPLTTSAWGDIADRSPLMSQMDAILTQQLKPVTGSKSQFEKNRESIEGDGQTLVVLARIIQDASYEYGDDETYLGYAKELERQTLEFVAATRDGAVEKAQSSLAQVQQSCTKCHEDYRGG